VPASSRLESGSYWLWVALRVSHHGRLATSEPEQAQQPPTGYAGCAPRRRLMRRPSLTTSCHLEAAGTFPYAAVRVFHKKIVRAGRLRRRDTDRQVKLA